MFVLAKVGFDLREQYAHLLEEPLPEETSLRLDALEAAEQRRL